MRTRPGFETRPALTRREALRAFLFGGAGMALTCGFSPRTLFAGDTVLPRPGARAKAVIQIWMWGGPSHLDTFDPKPRAGQDYTGPLNKALPTNVDGIQVGQMLPLLAKQADKYAIVRSMTHGVNGHETASYITQTGHTPGGKRIVYPAVGAVVSQLRGYDHGYKGNVPPYVVMTRPLGRFSESGFLGLKHKPFVTGGDPNQRRFAVEGIDQPGITRDRQRARRKLLHGLDSLGKAMPLDPRFTWLDQCEEEAYEMILGDAGQVFDLNREKADVRDRYGRTTFGQACLAARRLVESGVPYVAINYGGWDTHKRHFEAMRRNLPALDRGLATLIADLEDRGLLDSTVVWCGGEFGRTPKVQWGEPWNGGRGHYGKCFSHMLAGGGFSGGRVVGASDKRGEEVAERPVHPRDLIGSVYEQLGIDPAAPLKNPRGLDVAVLPPASDGGADFSRLREIMA
ncbi:MAG: DUF1501 domain-containing protein [Planctomycetota bacterium]|jgi:hypothetical protein